MPLIVAFIRPEHRAAVLDSIKTMDARVVSLSHVSDTRTPVVPRRVDQINKIHNLDAYEVSLGQVGRAGKPVSAGKHIRVNVQPQAPRLRLEVSVNEFLVDEVVDTIFFAAGMDTIEDDRTCNIVVLPVEEWTVLPDTDRD